ncbi:MAG: type VI secretion system TssO [Agriterribacter sp.]
MSIQKILNSQERTQAFLKFLLFFFITIVLVIIAVFFNFRLPLKDNESLTERLAIQRKEEMNQEKFAENMDKALMYLDSLDKDKKNLESIDILLKGKIEDLSILQQKAFTPYGRMNKVIIEKLLELKSQKLQLIKLSDKATAMAETEQKLQNAEIQLTQKQQELDQLRKGTGF